MTTKYSTSRQPKRGEVKARIFKDLISSVASAASKAGEAIGRISGGGGEKNEGRRPASAIVAPTTSDK